MIKLNIKIDNTVLNARLLKQKQALAKLPDQSLDEFKRLTPIDTGNARHSTVLEKTKTIIHANYAYAQRLDENWSRQTRGKGIVKPFLAWYKEQIKRIARIK